MFLKRVASKFTYALAELAVCIAGRKKGRGGR